MCVCVCVCVCERERERDVCLCVCLCVPAVKFVYAELAGVNIFGNDVFKYDVF